ncbi:hypothetical protein FOMPIDRAFT_127451, partial [Fomitopsis schrenkii]
MPKGQPTKQPSAHQRPSPVRQKSNPIEALLQKLKGSPPAYILVLGSTGTGKSTFINLVSGSKLGVGIGLESETATVQPTKPLKFGSERVIMVDTPGFDDTVKSEEEVLRTISDYLVDLRRRRISIRGVVYLHRITDNRMGGTALRNFRMFHAICGASAMKNAIIVLNMWDRTKSDVYEPREKELRNVFFQPAMKNGASILRHDGSKASGELILSTLLERPAVDLAIQTEMVDQGMALRTTEAGLALLGDLAGRERKHAEELRRIRGELKEARLRRD